MYENERPLGMIFACILNCCITQVYVSIITNGLNKVVVIIDLQSMIRFPKTNEISYPKPE